MIPPRRPNAAAQAQQRLLALAQARNNLGGAYIRREERRRHAALFPRQACGGHHHVEFARSVGNMGGVAPVPEQAHRAHRSSPAQYGSHATRVWGVAIAFGLLVAMSVARMLH